MTPPTTHSNNDPTNKTDPLGLKPCDFAFSRASTSGGFDPCANPSLQGLLGLFGSNGLCTPRIPSPFGKIQACVDPGGVIDAVNPFDDIIEWLAKSGDAALLFVLEQVARVVAVLVRAGAVSASPLSDLTGAFFAAMSAGKVQWFCGISPGGLPMNCVSNDDRRTKDAGKQGNALGHWIFCEAECEGSSVYVHERVHVGHYDEFGDLYDVLYVIATRVGGSYCGNKYEQEAFSKSGETCVS